MAIPDASGISLALGPPDQPPTRDEWLDLVERTLRGRSIGSLNSTTLDDIEIRPLYTEADPRVGPDPRTDQYPGMGRRSRGGRARGGTAGWDIRSRFAFDGPDDLDRLNEAILTELENGASSVELWTAGLDEGDRGIDQLDRLLDGVLLDLAPVALRSGWWYRSAAESYLGLLERRSISADDAKGELGVDPIGHLGDHGELHRSPDEIADDVAELAVRAGSFPQLHALRVGVERYEAAGASEAQELAAALATGVAYLRACTERGDLTPEAAFRQVVVGLAAGADQFLTIAKIRALRVLWARIADLCEITGPSAVPRIHLSTSSAMVARRDPWVNILRTTTAAFAAATGGADIITVLPFDAGLGVPDAMGRRLARNTQLILLEESQLHRVIDPAGGSWYVEELTNEIAAAAWARFTAIERRGGMVAALIDGSFAEDVEAAWNRRVAQVATRERPITGVSEFPNLEENLPQRERYPSPDRPPPTIALEVTAIGPKSLAGPFQRLRSRAESAPARPSIFLASLGPVATHTARSSFATNLFAAGGIAAVGTETGYTDPDATAAAFVESGCLIACICSSDRVYATDAEPTAKALKTAGAQLVFLAGAPGSNETGLRAAGVDGFVHVGCDALEALERSLTTLGVPT